MHGRAQHFQNISSSQGRVGFSSPTAFGLAPTTHVAVEQLPFLTEDWLADCLIRQQSERTIELRRVLVGRLQWFLNHRSASVCGTAELRAFFVYLTTGHRQEFGRWGYGQHHRATEPLRPATVRTYYAHLRSFFNWLVGEELLAVSPLATLKVPQARPDQIQPFSREQVESLVLAARRASYPQRDEAILLFLLDTGLRASELCTLKISDVDLHRAARLLTGRRARHTGARRNEGG